MMPRMIAPAAIGAALALVVIAVLVVPRMPSLLGAAPPAATQSQEQQMTICHQTGSPTNPWVFMTIDASTWPEHQAQGDVQARSLSDCGPPPEAPPALAAPVQAPTQPAAAPAPATPGAVATVETAGMSAAAPDQTPPDIATLPPSGGQPDRPMLALLLLGLGACGLALRRFASGRY